MIMQLYNCLLFLLYYIYYQSEGGSRPARPMRSLGTLALGAAGVGELTSVSVSVVIVILSGWVAGGPLFTTFGEGYFLQRFHNRKSDLLSRIV